MTDISNKTVASLLLLVLVVTVVGTVFSVSKLGDISGQRRIIRTTGAISSDVGSATAAIGAGIAMTLRTAAIAFGTVTLQADSACSEDSQTGAGANADPCLDGGTGANAGIVLENVGNTKLSIKATHADASAALFTQAASNLKAKARVKQGTGTILDGTDEDPPAGTAFIDYTSFATAVATATRWVAKDLSYADSGQIYYDLQYTFSPLEGRGAKDTSVTLAVCQSVSDGGDADTCV